MKTVISFFIVSTILISPSALDDVRKNILSINSLEQVDNFIELLQDDLSIESKGYLASMNFMKSHYTSSPFKKLKYFNIGKKSLDSLIDLNPNNIEIRYLRFMMQKKIPSFLGYNKHMDDDFNFIINGIENKSLPDSLNSLFLINLLRIDNLSELEKDKINLLLLKQ